MPLGIALAEIAVDGPIAAARSAVGTLRTLADDDDAEAACLLGAALGRELGLETELAELAQALAGAGPAPASPVADLLRIYVLGFRRHDFIAQLDPLLLAMAHVRGADDVWHAFGRMVSRESSLQHEALRAYARGAFVVCASQFVEHGMATKISMRTSLDAINQTCMVVPGDNSDTKLRFGRDLLLRLANAQSFISVFAHEFGHHMLDARGIATPSLPEAQRRTEVAQKASELLGSARADGSGKPQSALVDGIGMLCSYNAAIGGYTHVSLSASGAPIERDEAAGYALVILAAEGADPGAAVAAYSNRGIFHFAFAAGAAGTPAAKPAAYENGAAWFAALQAARRVVRTEHDMPPALGLMPPLRAGYGLDPQSAQHDYEELARLALRPPTKLDFEALKNMVAAAARCAETGMLAKLLALETRLPQRAALVEHLMPNVGGSLYAVREGDETAYVCPEPAALDATLALLHEAGADPDERIDEARNTLLIEASGRSAKLVRALLACGAGATLANAAGETALHAAAAYGSAETVRTLLDAGAGVNAATTAGVTPLMRAAERGEPAVVRALLDAGADADAEAGLGETPLHYAVVARAAQDPIVAIVEALATAGAFVDADTKSGVTPLALAQKRGLAKVAQSLIAHGATHTEGAPAGRGS